MTNRHFVNCISNNTKIIRLFGACDRDFEYNIFFDSLWRSHIGALVPSVLAMCLLGEAVQRMGRSRVACLCYVAAVALCVLLWFVDDDPEVIWTGGMALGFMMGGLAALTLLAIETYSTPLRYLAKC